MSDDTKRIEITRKPKELVDAKALERTAEDRAADTQFEEMLLRLRKSERRNIELLDITSTAFTAITALLSAILKVRIDLHEIDGQISVVRDGQPTMPLKDVISEVMEIFKSSLWEHTEPNEQLPVEEPSSSDQEKLTDEEWGPQDIFDNGPGDEWMQFCMWCDKKGDRFGPTGDKRVQLHHILSKHWARLTTDERIGLMRQLLLRGFSHYE